MFSPPHSPADVGAERRERDLGHRVVGAASGAGAVVLQFPVEDGR